MVVDQKMSSVEKKQLSPMTSLPHDVILDILARVPRFDYPKLSLVSKHFRSLVTLHDELYARRSLLGCTEHSLYFVLFNSETSSNRLYFLCRKANHTRLVLIPSLPAMPRDGFYVAVGSKIYVFCVTDNVNKIPISSSIDCRSHTMQPIPIMPIPIVTRVANVLDRKIYVFGYSYEYFNNVIVVFNTETQRWEPEIIKPDMELGLISSFSVVMADKLYVTNSMNNFVYGPKEGKWGTDEMLNSKNWYTACVVEDRFCYLDINANKVKLRAYNQKQNCLGEVKGLEGSLSETISHPWWSDTVDHGGKVVLLSLIGDEDPMSGETGEVLCAEIALEERQGEIWGEIEWCDYLVITTNLYLIESLVVTV